MIHYKTGNLLAEEAEAIVNTVNCVGVMGRGIALQFKNVFPENYQAYARACKEGEVQPGRMFVFKTGSLTDPKYIINFPTKRHWKGKSRMEDIDSGLTALADEIRQRGIRSIAIPPLGCGLGGLDWREVRNRIERVLSNLDEVRVVVFQPDTGDVEARPNYAGTVPRLTPGRAALVGLMQRYLEGLLDPYITLLEVHKLMYFMQAAGEPLKLRFQKAHYGPFAENLGHVLKVLEGHMVSGYADGGDAPGKQLMLLGNASEEAYDFLEHETATLTRFDRVSALVEGFESPFGLELLATVHWVAEQEQAKEIETVIERTYAWNERKKQFSGRQIQIAFEMLSKDGWFTKF